MSDLQFENISDLLLEQIPELKPVYEAKEQFSGKRFGPHVVYGDILNPVLVQLIESRDNDDLLARMFRFLELLATKGTRDVQDVVRVTVCEYLGKNQRWLTVAREFMGPQTLDLSEQIQRQWGL